MFSMPNIFNIFSSSSQPQPDQLDIPLQNRAKKILDSNISIIKDNFEGNEVYFIKISPDAIDLKKADNCSDRVDLHKTKMLLEKLDANPNSRATNEIFNFLTSGHYIEATAGENAARHHDLYARSLYRPVVYMGCMLNDLKNILSNHFSSLVSLREFLLVPIRQSLAKGMFELEIIPNELDNAFKAFSAILSERFDNFEENIKFNLMNLKDIEKNKRASNPMYIQAKKQYFEAVSAFLSKQSQQIISGIRHFSMNEPCYHLISLSIIELIKEEDPNYRKDRRLLNDYLAGLSDDNLICYLKHPSIITIPASILAGDTLMIVLSCALLAVTNNSAICQEMREYLGKSDFLQYIHANNVKDIKTFFDRDTDQNGLLHRIYLESLRRENIYKTPKHLALETLQFRHAANPITISGFDIPAGSSLIFLPALLRLNDNLWQKPELFDPNRFKNTEHLSKYSSSFFSVGKRKCPAHQTSSYLFKIFFSYIVMNYDITFDFNISTDLNDIKFKLEPITNKKKNSISL